MSELLDLVKIAINSPKTKIKFNKSLTKQNYYFFNKNKYDYKYPVLKNISIKKVNTAEITNVLFFYYFCIIYMHDQA